MTFPQYLQPWDNRYGEVGNIFLINFFDQRVVNTPVCIWLFPVLRCSSNHDHSPHRVSLVPSTQPMAGGQSIPSRWHALHSPDVRRWSGSGRYTKIALSTPRKRCEIDVF